MSKLKIIATIIVKPEFKEEVLNMLQTVTDGKVISRMYYMKILITA
ncbi:hypothetical protein [Lacinutrix sp. MEBiC02404]